MEIWIKTTKTASILVFCISLIWLVLQPDFEPLVAFIPSFAALTGYLLPQNSKYQKILDKRLSFVLIIISTIVISVKGTLLFQETWVSPNKSTIPKINPQTIAILVADFNGPNPTEYRLTELIIKQLRDATLNYKNVEIVPLGYAISELDGSSVARRIGDSSGADIVLWGWYGVTSEIVPVSVNVEITGDLGKVTPIIKGACNVNTNQLRRASVKDLHNITLQTQLSEELTAAILFPLGVAALLDNDYQLAISYFSDAISQIPDLKNLDALSAQVGSNSERLVDKNFILFLRALTKRISGDLKSAIDDYSQIIASDNSLESIYFERAQTYAEAELYKEAISDYSKIIELQGKNIVATVLYERGKIYDVLKEFDLAIQDYNKALTLNSTQIAAQINYEWESDGIGISKIIQINHEAINRDSDNTLAYFSQGLAHVIFDVDSSSAIPLFNNALLLNPEISEAYVLRAQIYKTQGDQESALIDYNNALALDSGQSPCNYFRRSRLYEKMGNITKSKEDLQEAVVTAGELIGEGDPNVNSLDLAHHYYVRGLANLELGNKDLGLSDLEKVLEIEPEFPGKAEVLSALAENSSRYLTAVWMGLGLLLIIVFSVIYQASNHSNTIWNFSKRKIRQRIMPINANQVAYNELAQMAEASSTIKMNSYEALSEFEILLAMYKNTKEYGMAHILIGKHIEKNSDPLILEIAIDFYRDLLEKTDGELLSAKLAREEINKMLDLLEKCLHNL